MSDWKGSLTSSRCRRRTRVSPEGHLVISRDSSGGRSRNFSAVRTKCRVRLRQGEGLRLDAALPDKGGKMGTAGLAGQPLKNNQRDAHATTGA